LTWYLISQIKKLGIRVELGQEVTPALVEKLRPDVVIVATGATPIIPDIPGVGLKHVVIANDVLSGAAIVTGRRIAVVGGGFVGVEVAHFLLDRGKEVTIVIRRKRMGQGIIAISRAFIEKRLIEEGLKVLASTNVEEITDKGIVVSTDGHRQVLEADTVVLARGVESCKGLGKQLEGKVAELYTIGDCVEPRKAIDAIYEGWRVARTI
jgi:2,4-dienoyl-CoA reductase (NADPH2)